MEINVTSNKSFYFNQRRLFWFEKGELRQIIDDLLLRGIIRNDKSCYSSPVVLTKRKKGDLGLCVDYHALN